ncbi:MAG: PIG-L family deacetylase [Planctomycetia bacterium]|nr:PIG-L family deacetylase [Planctomycetia bacterium]
MAQSTCSSVISPDVGSTSRIEAPFRFTRLENGIKRRTDKLAEVIDGSEPGATWLFVSPHDDDLCIGAGLTMQAARQAGVDVQVLIVTDGCLGYCRAEQRESIAKIRREETYESFEMLGIARDHVTYINYPDGGLTPYVGRRPARNLEPAIEGYVGLQNVFTYYLREFRPNCVFVPTPTDLHPDHQITHNELLISLFHASGDIWPELGAPLAVPQLFEMAIYCDFAEAPNLEVQGNADAFQHKLRSIEAYRSQLQIASLVESIRNDGPYEYLRDVHFRLYSSKKYRSLFAD